MTSFIINVPLKLPIKTKKSNWFYLNLNIYRNAHFFMLNKAKQMFEETVWNQVKNLPKFKYIGLEYTLYPGSSHRVDISNTCCIVDKFFCDTLVNAKVIEDDNSNIVRVVRYVFGQIDKKNPHVEIFIEGELQ